MIRRLIVLGLVVLLVVGVASAWRGFGQMPAVDERIARSPQWRTDHFANPEPMWNDTVGSLRRVASGAEEDSPSGEVPRAVPAFAEPPVSGLRVTWFGHSTSLVEIDGARVLMDPVWSERVSPVTWTGPKRWFPPIVALDALPALDAILISHDHYDHLDRATALALADTTHAVFITPLGIGSHLAYWGIPRERIKELD